MKMDESFVEGMLRNLAKRYVKVLRQRGDGDFDDALQEARIAFYKIRDKAEPKNWRYWTWWELSNTLRREYHIRSRQSVFEMPTTEDWQLSDNLSDNRVENVLETNEYLDERLEKLTPKERDIVVSLYINGESKESIADRYGILTTTLETYLSVARRKMRGGYIYSAERRRAFGLAMSARRYKMPKFQTSEERREYEVEYRKRLLEKKRKYYQEHKEQLLAKNKKWYSKNKVYMISYRKKRRQDHLEDIREYNRRYYAEHREEIRQKQREYRLKRKLKKNEDHYSRRSAVD